jgi:hypothetical protein
MCPTLTTKLYASDIELTLKELCNKSSDIVMARINSTESYFNKEEKRIFTRIELEIINSIKGQTRSLERISMITIGGTVEGISTLVIGAPKYILGEQSLLFLYKVILPDKTSNYIVIGQAQGKYNISKESGTENDLVVRDQISLPLRLENGGEYLSMTDREAVTLKELLQQIKMYIN